MRLFVLSITWYKWLAVLWFWLSYFIAMQSQFCDVYEVPLV